MNPFSSKSTVLKQEISHIILSADEFFHGDHELQPLIFGGTEPDQENAHLSKPINSANDLFTTLFDAISKEQLSAKLYNLLYTTTSALNFSFEFSPTQDKDAWLLPFIYVISQAIPEDNFSVQCSKEEQLMDNQLVITHINSKQIAKINFSQHTRQAIETELILAIKEISK